MRAEVVLPPWPADPQDLMIVVVAIREERVVRIEVQEHVTIQRAAWEVREHFRAITHHAGNDLHPRLRMAVTERRGDHAIVPHS
jgi:hypothetical protein